MNVNSLRRSHQPGLRLASNARAWLAVSALAALAVSASSLAQAQSNLLVAGDFEGINSLTSYSATTTGVWGTETSVLSGAGNGVTPFGSQMLLLTHGGGGTASQTNQIIQGPFAAGSVVTFTAKFNTWLTGKTVALIIQPSAGLSLTGPRPTSPTLALDTNTSTWQTVTVTTTLTSAANYISAEIVLWQVSGALSPGTPQAYVDDAVLTVFPAVYASGVSPVTSWDPIFLDGPVVPDYSESKPVPTVGYNDPRWAGSHLAYVFPKDTHPWESDSWVPAAFKFDAFWINAWAGGGQLNRNPGLESHRHGKTSSSPGWAPYNGVPYQSFTKYSTTVYGEGTYVLQFLADNASWIYIDGVLIGYQDWNWSTNGTGRYTIELSGSGPHDLGFVIWDGGGLAGGKFRLETKASFLANNPGATLPRSPATVTLSNLSHTYDGTPKAATVTTSPAGLTTSVTYNGSTTPPTAAGSYNVVATVMAPNYLGSALGTLTIAKATATITLANLEHTYDGAVKSATATTVPAGLSVVLNYSGARINAGSYDIQALVNNPNYTGSLLGTLQIAKADATVTVNGYTGTYDGLAHGASGSATGVDRVDLSAGLNLGATFTNAPGGTVNWTFSGGTNYNDASGTAAIVISKANATVVVTPYNVTYDGQPHSATVASITGVNGETGATVGTVTLNTTHTDAGTYTDSWSFTGTANYNHIASTPVTNKIAKADATVTVNGYTGTYDGLAHGASGSATGVDRVDLSAGLNLGATFTNVPGGTAHWTFSGGTNYNDASGTAAIVISRASATVAVTPYNVTYDGQPHSATVASITGVNGETGATVGAVTLNTTHTDAGTYADSWSFTGTANYNKIVNAPITNTIAKANASVTVNGYTGTYDGLAHGASGSATGVDRVDLSAGLTLGATFTNVPGGTAHWTFSGGTNYNDASGTAAIVITKANATVVVTPYEAEYDGLSHTATASITGVNGETGVTVGTVNLSNTTHTALGTYADTWSFTGTGNYNSVGATPITNIIKDTLAPTITSVSTNAPTLWPPNHKMVAVTVNALANDVHGVTSLVIKTVTSNEPENGLGDGDTAGDIVFTRGSMTVNLRAERGGKGNGRIYTITVEAMDSSGNASTRTVTVSVPKSQGK